MEKNLILTVFYTMKPGCRETFLNRVRDEGIQTAIREEDGCLCYDYYCSAEDKNLLLLVEKWTSPEKQKIHMSQPHMQRLLAIKDDCVANTRFGKLREED
ncbi:MAG: hypothetical protein GXW99_10680 [Clostridiales bacterium]|nr:hypothetical protein [Clostridiales bacterium]